MCKEIQVRHLHKGTNMENTKAKNIFKCQWSQEKSQLLGFMFQEKEYAMGSCPTRVWYCGVSFETEGPES